MRFALIVTAVSIAIAVVIVIASMFIITARVRHKWRFDVCCFIHSLFLLCLLMSSTLYCCAISAHSSSVLKLTFTARLGLCVVVMQTERLVQTYICR